MKFNINPKELLALHNTLYEKFDRHCGDLRECRDDDPCTPDAVLLKQLYDRVRACIVDALSDPSRGVDKFDAWQDAQQKKIADLTTQLDDMKPGAIVSRVCDDTYGDCGGWDDYFDEDALDVASRACKKR